MTNIIQYNTSEIRLIESMEDICEVMLQYNMHKEREGMTHHNYSFYDSL